MPDMSSSDFGVWREACGRILRRPCRSLPPAREASPSVARAAAGGAAAAAAALPRVWSRSEAPEKPASGSGGTVGAANAMPTQADVDDWSQHVETEDEFQRRIQVEKWGSSLLANSA